MAIDIVVLVATLGLMVYLPFVVVRTVKSGYRFRKALKHPDGKRWLVVAICAGEIAGFGPVLQFVLKYFFATKSAESASVSSAMPGIYCAICRGYWCIVGWNEVRTATLRLNR